MATEALPVPAQFKAQLDKCKSVRSADTYCKPWVKTAEVSLLHWYNFSGLDCILSFSGYLECIYTLYWKFAEIKRRWWKKADSNDDDDDGDDTTIWRGFGLFGDCVFLWRILSYGIQFRSSCFIGLTSPCIFSIPFLILTHFSFCSNHK